MSTYWIVKITDEVGKERITRFKTEYEAKVYWQDYLVKTGRITNPIKLQESNYANT